MSAIRSRGRRGSTVVPNWRWEDGDLDPFEFRVAGWLASHADSYRAERVSRNEIAKRVGVSGPKVSAAIERLEELGVVTLDVGERGRWVITFDFDVWERDSQSSGSETPGRPGATLPVTGSDAPGAIGTHEEEHEQETPMVPVLVDTTTVDLVDDFDRFWAAYPRKVGKTGRYGAASAFKAAVKRGMRIDQALATIEAWRGYWASGSPEFIPHPSTWLNQGRWEDGPPPERRLDTTKMHPRDVLVSAMRQRIDEARSQR